MPRRSVPPAPCRFRVRSDHVAYSERTRAPGSRHSRSGLSSARASAGDVPSKLAMPVRSRSPAPWRNVGDAAPGAVRPSGHHYCLFCRLDYEAEGASKPWLAIHARSVERQPTGWRRRGKPGPNYFGKPTERRVGNRFPGIYVNRFPSLPGNATLA